MQPDNRSSFIPKKSIKRVERVRSGRRIYILSYIAYAVFFATLVASGVIYFYAQYLQKELTTKIEELETQRVAFSQSSIEKVKDLERKLKLSEYFFDRHSSAYTVLHEIERLAVDKVVFKSFNYTRQENDEILISVNGGSNRFDEVAFQTSLLTRSNFFSDSVFTELTKQDQLAQSLDAVNPRQGARTVDKATEAESVITPVSFSFTTMLNFDELAFDPEMYTESVGIEPANLEATEDSMGEDAGVADTLVDFEDSSVEASADLTDDTEL